MAYPVVKLIEDRKAEVHKYIRQDTGEEVPSVSRIKTAMKLQDLSKIPLKVLQNARDRGIAVHSVCDEYEKGTLNKSKIHPDVLPYFNAFKLFCKERKPKLLYSEYVVYSLTHNFAGKFDGVYEIGGKIILIDYKATREVNKAYSFQTGFYKIAYEEQEGKNIDERWIVQLKPDGTYKVYNCDDIKCKKMYNPLWREGVINLCKRYHSRVANKTIDNFENEIFSF